jgi:hypothetical protein
MNVYREFLDRIAERLEGFQRKPTGVCTFRCPICGDSKIDPAKRRGSSIRTSER